ncbi:EF-hand domain-containing protein [Candidatus Albibeggiatoa sp. nov. NOAA]|uniref:EF-hand domain-containing protein n=1 Tax=Candidatus Albibeggiatoa sp. nov. NOAA TaxID=3162724 RepID=UPI00330155C0|nr:EF-hand domain-containing protein [Thiotrichaceae bacterium]
MRTVTTLSALTLGLAIAGSAAAMPFGSCDSDVRKQVLLAKYDTVAPVGTITLDEVQAVRLAKFQEMDADGNGSITTAERDAYRAAQKQAHFTASDTDGDGQLSATEFLQATPPHWPEGVEYTATNTTRKQYKFNRLDTDANGYVTLAELQATSTGRHGKYGHLSRLDNDANGEISQAEFLANVRLFNYMDTNEDGVITEAEIDAAPCGRGGHRGFGRGFGRHH